MEAETPTPQTTLVILLGASAWPYSPDFHESEAFANSASDLRGYFLDPHRFSLPKENLLDLFNSNQSPDELDKEIGQFLDRRISEMKESDRPARDLLAYFAGHGGFSGGDSHYYLAIRRTRMENPMSSSIQIGSLAYTIKEKARYLRRIIILDCCFAASASQFFQTSEPAQAAIIQTIDAFKVEGKGIGVPVPPRGTSLLCSSRHNVPSLISPDNRYTMFSEGLLHTLHIGNPYQQESISLRTVARLIEDFLRAKYKEKEAPRPEVHSPDQSEGDVADIPLFPNFAGGVGKNPQNAFTSPIQDYTVSADANQSMAYGAPYNLREPKFINSLPRIVVSERFKNRDKEQADIVTMLRENVRLVSIYGRGGLGKTTLACKVLGDLQSAKDCPYDMVHLSMVNTGISLDSIFAGFGKLLMGDTKDSVDAAWRDPQMSTAQKVSGLLDNLRKGRYVLLLDGLEHLQNLRTYKLIDLDMRIFFETVLQQGGTLRILVTSRFPLALPLPLKSWERLVPLEEGLPIKYAIDLLRTLDPDGRAGLRKAPAKKLKIFAKKTSGFPLALESVAGLLLASKQFSPDDLLRDEQMFASKITETIVQQVIVRLSPEMIRVMEALALFGRPVTRAALEFLLVPLHLNISTLYETLDGLVNSYFVAYDTVKKTFVLHQIDREYCYSRIPEGSLDDKFRTEPSAPYTRYALHYSAANFYERVRKPRAEWRSLDDLVPQLSEFEHRILADDYDTAAHLINLIDSNYLSLWGHVRTVQGMRQQLIAKITDRGLEEINVGSLGNAYYNLGQFEQAIDMYQQALTLSREIGNRSGAGTWLGSLAKAYRNGKKLRDAVDYFQQALAISRETSKKSEEETNLDNLGLTYADLGEYERALEYGQQALAIALEIKDQRGESAILGNLGNAYYGLKQYEQAVNYHRQALEIAREVGDRRREGIHLGNLGRAYAALGQYEQAFDNYEQALRIAREVADRRGEGYRLDYLGRAYAELGQYERAIDNCEHAVAIAHEIGHKRNEGMALSSLGLIYDALEQHERAIEYHQQARALFESLALEHLVEWADRNIAQARSRQSSSQI